MCLTYSCRDALKGTRVGFRLRPNTGFCKAVSTDEMLQRRRKFIENSPRAE